MKYTCISEFPVRSRLYVFMINELSLVADIFVEKLALVVFLHFFMQKEVKIELFRYRVKAQTSYLFCFLMFFAAV